MENVRDRDVNELQMGGGAEIHHQQWNTHLSSMEMPDQNVNPSSDADNSGDPTQKTNDVACSVKCRCENCKNTKGTRHEDAGAEIDRQECDTQPSSLTPCVRSSVENGTPDREHPVIYESMPIPGVFVLCLILTPHKHDTNLEPQSIVTQHFAFRMQEDTQRIERPEKTSSGQK